MGDDYRPGKPKFWNLWAIGLPICVAVMLVLVYGKRPWAVGIDLWEHARLWLEHYELVEPKDEMTAQRRAKSNIEAHKMAGVVSVEKDMLKKRTSRRKPDEEYGVAL
jgi:hypothetical protein